MTSNIYTITDICQQLSVSRYAIARLCNRGLIPYVKRNKHGRRIFNQTQVDLINILIKMRSAGFSSKEIRHYSRLYRQGESTAEQRLAMLTTRKRQLWQEIKERQEAIDFIERQEEIFGQKPSEKPSEM